MRLIESELIDNGYHLDSNTGVFQSSSYTDIAYSDGDESENRVLNVIKKAKDLSSLSDELETHCTDWPSTYHLSKRRGNLLRPFVDHLKNKTVLEIGSGMGPITRLLGESNANVLALEGTSRRAYATRMRTRDLENVTVLAEKFDNFRTNLKFDVITLIGVLEYSNLYINAENPHADVLSRCFNMLKPDGSLIIAIENKLGLKYFAGAKEDHVGIPMFGLEDRYNLNSVRTFGRTELKKLLCASGFEKVTFNAPLPDYKLTTSVITEFGFKEKRFHSADLTRDSFGADPQLPATLAFTPELVLSSLSQNNLELELANSFLVVASKGSKTLTNESQLGWHFSTNRLKAYCVQTEFRRSDSGEIEVQKSKMSHSNLSGPLTQNIVENTKYLEGKLLRDYFELLLSTPSWKHSDLSEILDGYKSFLLGFQSFTDPAQEKYFLVEGSIDLIPRNIVIDSDLKWCAFDAEWSAASPVDLRQIIFRAVFSLHTISHFAIDEHGNLHTPKSLFVLFCRLLGLHIDDVLISEFLSLEARYQSSVSGSRENVQAFNDYFLSPLGRHKFQPYSILINVAERDVAVAERERILNSTIWRLFSPYRMVRNLFSRH